MAHIAITSKFVVLTVLAIALGIDRRPQLERQTPCSHRSARRRRQPRNCWFAKSWLAAFARSPFAFQHEVSGVSTPL